MLSWRIMVLWIGGALLMTFMNDVTAPGEIQRATEPTGASAAFTTRDPLVIAVRQLIEQGRFADAERALRMNLDAAHPAAEEMFDIIGRIRAAYSLDAEGLLARLRDSIPDVAPADLERWRLAGHVDYRMIDGRLSYFAREPANIFRFCDEAKQRRNVSPIEPPKWKLEDHLARVIAASQRESKPLVVPVRHRVRYALTIKPDAPYSKAGAVVRVWLPFPQEHERQRDVTLLSIETPPRVLAPTFTHLGGTAQRTAYFEQRVTDPSKPLEFAETFAFTSSAYYPALDDAQARSLPSDWSGGNLDERPPHILFKPRLRKTVAEVVGNETNPLAKARRIFHFIALNVSYCAEEEYSTIPSLSDKALTRRRGDCGVQSMLFITMCRCAGIPARWQSGWQTKRDGPDMHDWAEFYVAPWGWLPADPSYGLRQSADPRIREFYFGHQDSCRMIVNVDYGCPLLPPKRSLRSEPLDFQRGEVEIDGHNLYFPYWDYDIDVQWLERGS